MCAQANQAHGFPVRPYGVVPGQNLDSKYFFLVVSRVIRGHLIDWSLHLLATVRRDPLFGG